jgi:hypothetical protein
MQERRCSPGQCPAPRRLSTHALPRPIRPRVGLCSAVERRNPSKGRRANRSFRTGCCSRNWRYVIWRLALRYRGGRGRGFGKCVQSGFADVRGGLANRERNALFRSGVDDRARPVRLEHVRRCSSAATPARWQPPALSPEPLVRRVRCHRRSLLRAHGGAEAERDPLRSADIRKAERARPAYAGRARNRPGRPRPRSSPRPDGCAG